jgi:hypothetical protein
LVGVFDFKSVLIPAGDGRGTAALYQELKRILAIYQEATPRCDRSVANPDLLEMAPTAVGKQGGVGAIIVGIGAMTIRSMAFFKG